MTAPEMHTPEQRHAYWLSWRENRLREIREADCMFCALDFEELHDSRGRYHMCGVQRVPCERSTP